MVNDSKISNELLNGDLNFPALKVKTEVKKIKYLFKANGFLTEILF